MRELTPLERLMAERIKGRIINARDVNIDDLRIDYASDGEYTVAELFLASSTKRVEVGFCKFNRSDSMFQPELGQNLSWHRALRRFFTPEDQEPAAEITMTASAG